MKVLIITGGSKGIGNGIVKAYLSHGYQIFSIARSKNQNPSFAKVVQIEFDLSDSVGAAEQIKNILLGIDQAALERLLLINNAGTLGQINTVDRLEAKDIQQTINLNTVTPLVLSSAFIQYTKNWACAKKIINISSGAAYKPYYGWTVYCASKAAIDMMTKSIALEQDELVNGVTTMAIYPGVVDTDMQAQIRQSNEESFKEINRFLALKAENTLADLSTVGQQIFEVDQQNLPNGTVLRLS